MKIWKSIKLFTISSLMIVAVCSCVSCYTKGTAHRIFVFIAELLVLLIAIRWTVYVLKLAKKNGQKLFRFLWNSIRRGFQKANLAVMRMVNRHGVRVHHYQDKIESITISGSKQKYRLFPLGRWRDMHTVNEQVRYLYRKHIQKAIRRGFHFKAAETPNEIGALFSRLDKLSNAQLFFLYNRARYAAKSEITPEDLQSLLDSFGHRRRKG